MWAEWNDYQSSSIVSFAIFSALAVSGVVFRKRNAYYRRYPTIDDLHPRYLKGTHCLKGYAVTVKDGDNFRLYHTPEITQIFWFLTGKRQAKFKKSTHEEMKSMRKEGSIPIRLAGVDAPESAHFGMTAQPLSKEATEYLKNLLQVETTSFIHLRKVVIQPFKRDQYSRLVCFVFYQPIPFIPYYKNISEEMIKKGLAVVYTAAGAEYGGLKDKLVSLQDKAKHKKVGVWGLKDFISPGDYKEAFRSNKQ
eukprot:NODE_19_length_47148_cov_1.447810.p24 type:complete len:250 gc:universal NODE_19_length_47148_cov_1.447810:23559-22810(-)